MIPSRRYGFTLVEILIILLVVGVGLSSVVALAAYGNRIAGKIEGESIALATAISVAYDPQPRLDAAVAGSWTYAPYDIDASGTLVSTAEGYLNGVYVTRTETSLDRDVLARDAAARVQVRSAHVQVVVSDSRNGGELATFVTRIVRQRGLP